MPRTNTPSVSVYRYLQTAYTNAGFNSINFNIALSAETSTNISTLSTDQAGIATTPLLSGTLYPTALSGLSATATGIFLRWPTNSGTSDIYGFVAASSTIPATSSFTATIEFNDLSFYTNTAFYISGNKTASIIDYPTTQSTIDNPFFSVNDAVSDVNGVNNRIRTVAEHLRRWNLNG